MPKENNLMFPRPIHLQAHAIITPQAVNQAMMPIVRILAPRFERSELSLAV